MRAFTPLILAFALAALPRVFAANLAAPADGSDSLLAGSWVLDAAHSDEPRKALKGLRLMREAKFEEKPAARGSAHDARYYAQRELLEKKRAEGAVADVGPIQRVLEARRIDIEDSGAAVMLRYEDGWSRSLAPTVGGPVYSAKGTEYQRDALGLTLSYRRDGSLFIETVLQPRGHMTEELRVNPTGHTLTVKTTIANPDWIVEAHIKRVYTRTNSQ